MATWSNIAYWSIALAVAVAWLGVVTLVVGMCLSAARGDRALRRADVPSSAAGQPEPGSASAQPEPARFWLVA
jgi:hypothetical protein